MLLPSVWGESLFDDFFDSFAKPVVRGTKNFSLMKTDVKELDNSYELHIELPGLSKDDVEIELKNGYLTVSATHGAANDEKDEDGKFIRRERYYGSSSRSFYVGDAIDKDDIKAKFDSGILRLTIPKPDESKRLESRNLINIED